MKVLLSSGSETPDKDKIFVIEENSVSREKKRYGDIINELNEIAEQTQNLAKRKVELEAIKLEMDKILKP